MQAVILAGGLGTRLRPMTQNVPKAMALVSKKPFLEYEICLLRKSGINDFVLCVGYLGKMVEDYFGDGSRWGVRIRFSYDGPKPMGPAGALRKALPFLGDFFFVTYGDAYLRANYQGVMEALLGSSKLGVMTVYHNRNMYGNSDVVVRGDRIVRYDKKSRGKGMEWVNFGATALKKSALNLIASDKKCSEEEFYGELIRRHELLAFIVQERFYEIGNLESLREFKQFISSEPHSEFCD